MRTFKLVNEKTNREIKMGSIVKDFRGDKLKVIGFTPPHKPSSTGRVRVSENGYETEYFPGVINAKIVEYNR